MKKSRPLNPKLLVPAVGVMAAILTFLVFSPALENEFIYWDDNTLITDNPFISSLDLTFIKWAFTTYVIDSWIPLTLVSLALDYALLGPDPWGFHLTNNLIHSANAFLVFLLVFRLIETRRARKGQKSLHRERDSKALQPAIAAALVTALLFALHPMRVESVVWISERKDVLFAFFYLLGLLAYLKYTSGTARAKQYYTASLALFACSCMSKPMAVTFPAVLLLIDFYPLERLGDGWKRAARIIIEKAPFFILALAVSLVALKSNVSDQTGELFGRDFAQLTKPRPFFTAFTNYIFYLYKMLVPVHLAAKYQKFLFTRPTLFELAGPLILFSAVTAFALLSLKKWRAFSIAWFFYIISLSPTIPVMMAANRFTYLACLGPFVLVGLLAGTALEPRRKKYLRHLTVAAVILAAGVLSALTIKQTGVWKNTITLWAFEEKQYPGNAFVAYNNRGAYFLSLGRIQEAAEEFEKAVSARPIYAEAHNNLGSAYLALGKTRQAAEEFKRALRFRSKNPADIHYNLGAAYNKLGLAIEAAKEFKKAIGLNPELFDARLNLAIYYHTQGDAEAAAREYKEALRIRPASIEARMNLGAAYLSLGKTDEAIEEFREVLDAAPATGAAMFNMGLAYQKKGMPGEARKWFEKTLKADPYHRGAKEALAKLNQGA